MNKQEKAELLHNAIGEIDEELILEAEKPSKPIGYRDFVKPLAVCAAVFHDSVLYKHSSTKFLEKIPKTYCRFGTMFYICGCEMQRQRNETHLTKTEHSHTKIKKKIIFFAQHRVCSIFTISFIFIL